jgi:hypothetical protein
MLTQLKDLLANDPNCVSFLSSKGLNPISTLADILTNDIFGHANISNNGDPYKTGAISGGIGGVQGQAITVNNQGAFFLGSTPSGQSLSVGPNAVKGGTPRAQGFILLHELGHTTGVLRPDADPSVPKAGELNDQDIQTNCAKTIAALSPK